MKLFEAKLAKAQLEKTEVSANANEQRLELQKMLLESDAKVMRTQPEHRMGFTQSIS